VPLRGAGWTEWVGFPDAVLEQAFIATHLRVQVWQKQSPPTVALTFGGTIFDNEMDWRANLRWFLPGTRDQYSDVVRRLAPAFVAEFIRRAESPDGGPLRECALLSVGHSLGGGLAQQFAYALGLTSRIPRVSKTYAFDPSPVTGFFSVDKTTRDANRRNLEIDRIYERGEILAIIRSAMSVLWKPSANMPRIRGIRYNLFPTLNPIAGHSMIRMAVKIDAARRLLP
jgi:pimeloyl-ACP methyl ester carboxylesterase